MRKLLIVIFIISVLSVSLYGCSGFRYGGNEFFPPYPYEFADPYDDYYYYDSYSYTPYYYRYPPPLLPEEGGGEFHFEEPDGR